MMIDETFDHKKHPEHGSTNTPPKRGCPQHPKTGAKGLSGAPGIIRWLWGRERLPLNPAQDSRRWVKNSLERLSFEFGERRSVFGDKGGWKKQPWLSLFDILIYIYKYIISKYPGNLKVVFDYLILFRNPEQQLQTVWLRFNTQINIKTTFESHQPKIGWQSEISRQQICCEKGTAWDLHIAT